MHGQTPQGLLTLTQEHAERVCVGVSADRGQVLNCDFCYRLGRDSRLDPRSTRADAKKAVEELTTQGITPFCLSLDPKADAYVREIFGNRWRVLDRIERLPEHLPMLYLALTK